MIALLLTLVLTFGLSACAVPMARRIAARFGMMDRPDGRLKHQHQAIPYLGGVAVFVAFLTGVVFAIELRPDLKAILLAASIAMFVGLADDLRTLSPVAKVVGQAIAVTALTAWGVQIELGAAPDWLELLLTFAWIIGIVNAFNLLDIMDGLCGAVGVVIAVFLGVGAWIDGDEARVIALVALAASLLGFLIHNWPPATIYLGDAGAMVLGFLLAALAVTEPTGKRGFSPWPTMLMLGVPILDTSFVVLARIWRRQPIFVGSPDHLPIRLLRAGMSRQRVVLTYCAAAAALGAAGLAAQANLLAPILGE